MQPLGLPSQSACRQQQDGIGRSQKIQKEIVLKKRGIFVSAALVVLTAVQQAAFAQGAFDSYPTRPVTLVNPLAGGGSSDVDFRRYIQSIQKNTGKQFVIDNKGGAGTTIGTAYVAKAPPDAIRS